MPRLDLLIVHPGHRAQVYQALGQTLAAVEPPIWAGLMATFVRRRGYSVAILDANARALSPADVAAAVADLAPRLVAVVAYGHQPSASTQVMPAAGAICSAIADTTPGIPVVLVGGHVAALPERTLREERTTFVSSGEGPHTLVGLIEALRSPAPKLEAVPDLCYREDGGIRHTVAAPLIRDLDGEMPEVAWDLLPMAAYRAHNWHAFGGDVTRQPYAALYTTLGCPYTCTFCCIQAPFKRGEAAAGLPPATNSYRFWSLDAVGRQLETLVTRFGVRHLKIADEMFVLNPRHVLGVCRLIAARGYDLNIWAYARVDTVKDEMIDALRQAGVSWLAFGIEAADARVREAVQKGFDQSLVYRTLERVRSAGIHVMGNYIFGLPEDDARSMQATLDLARELNTEFANFYCTMAYPGSALYAAALKERWPLPSSWSGYSQHAVDTQPLPTRHLTAQQVLRFRDAAFQTYFTNPAYLAMIERTFGAETLAHVRDMARIPLRRDLLPETMTTGI